MIWIFLISFVAALMLTIVFTPFVKAFAEWIGAVDAPNHRKVHTRIMPRMGGVALYLAFVAVAVPGLLWFTDTLPDFNHAAAWALVVGGFVIVLTGALDDKYELSARWKLLGQTVAALIVVLGFGLRVEFINLPMYGEVWTMWNMEWLSILLTVLWIVGITNAINLIDGLDGLAAGVSGIAIASLLVLAVLMGNATAILMCAILLGSIIGFLFFNFHPAKIFMGDSGALFLGFSLATLSILGFKQATLASFVVPLVMLGVPLSDTFFAIVRRVVNRKPISVADKSHLHHCLLQLGFSHRTTVLMIYGVASIFGVAAVVLSQASLWITIVVTAVLLLVMEIGAEAIGIVSSRKKPLLRLLSTLRKV